jgi:hypothetical protein
LRLTHGATGSLSSSSSSSSALERTKKVACTPGLAVVGAARPCSMTIPQLLAQVRFSSSPEPALFLLSQFAKDNFYKTVIAGNNGIPDIIFALGRCVDDPGVAECACLCLANLAENRLANQNLIQGHCGSSFIVNAMQRFPQSVALQIAAIQALSVIGLPTNEDGSLENEKGVLESLERAVTMFLRPVDRQLAEQLLERARQQKDEGLNYSF